MSSTITVDALQLRVSLAALRYSVFVVMAMWTVDKFINPGHAAAVFGAFYGLPGLGEAIFPVVGALQAAIVVAFVVGFAKRWSTLAVLLMHAVSTVTPLMRYLDPWNNPNLLFFAAWPMLAALVALYLLRDYDTLWQWRGQ